MKCPACGYTHETKDQFNIGGFEEVCISHCKIGRWREPDAWGITYKEDDELSFNICPECGCMFISRG